MKLNFRFILSFLVFVTSLILLGTGSETLLKPVINRVNFPLGTLITWIGIIALPLTIVFGSKTLTNPSNLVERVFHRVLKASVILNCTWGFISYWLAANWSFNFSVQEEFRGSPQAFEYFKYLTAVLVLFPLLTGFVYAIRKAINTVANHMAKEKN